LNLPRSGSTPVRPSCLRRILVIRPDEIGDFVLTVPALQAINAALPKVRMDLVTSLPVMGLARVLGVGNPVAAIPEFVPGPLGLLRWAFRVAELGRRLSANEYDLVLMPRHGKDTHLASLLGFMTGCRNLAGFVGGDPGEASDWDQLITMPVPRLQCVHELTCASRLISALRLADACTPTSAWLPGHPPRVKRGGTSETRVAVGLGAREPKRRWPVERYAKVLNAISSSRSIRVLLLGGGDVRQDADALQRLLPAAENRVGSLPIEAVPQALSQCDIFVGNDSALLHLAQAVGLPSVVISCHPRTAPCHHPNSPSRFGPILKNSVAIQPPAALPGCERGCVATLPHCILGIEVDEVEHCFRSLLDREPLREVGS
jgi:heptosyltransferase-2